MGWGITEWERLNHRLDDLTAYIRQRFNQMEDRIMAQSDEINASLDQLNQATNDCAQRLTDILAALKPGMSQAEVDAIKGRIQAEADRLGTWGQNADDPIPQS